MRLPKIWKRRFSATRGCVLIFLAIYALQYLQFPHNSSDDEHRAALVETFMKYKSVEILNANSSKYDSSNLTEAGSLQSSLSSIPKIDKTAKLSEEELVKEIQKNDPKLPIHYWFKNRYKGMRYKENCAKFPNLLDVKYDNTYWQSLKTDKGTFFLYSSFYDNRDLFKTKPAIRILSMYNSLDIDDVNLYCQIWLNNKKQPVFSEVTQKRLIWDSRWGSNIKGDLRPYLLTCKIPTVIQNEVPEAVSLVRTMPCYYANTLLRVINNQPKKEMGKEESMYLGEPVVREENKTKKIIKEGIAVCVKGLDYMHSDLSVQLVEWLELLSALGANKVFMYVYETHPNVTKVLKHYEKKGFLDITHITLPGNQPNLEYLRHWFHKGRVWSKRNNEVIPYNDCFYRNMNNFKYITLLDTDEVIMPKKDYSWQELLKRVVPKSKTEVPRDSYYFRNVYFMDSMREAKGWASDIPKYMHKAQNVYRSALYTHPRRYIKCFHDTDRVETVHNHLSLTCLNGGCKWYLIEFEDGHLQHYRNDCVKELRSKCDLYKKDSVKDTSIWRFKDQLVSQTVNTLKVLGFLSS